MYTTTLLAGERSGNLPEVLERYISFQKVALTFRKKLVALAYLSLPPAWCWSRAADLSAHRGGAAVCPAL